MSRVARIVVPGFAHHVTQRGNRRAEVFETDEDRQAYLRFLKQYTERHALEVWAYCLMTNHVHLVVVPAMEHSLARALRDTHTVYAMRFNTRTQVDGHVWQGRFYSCPLDEAHLWAAVRYVERNPVRAGNGAVRREIPLVQRRGALWTALRRRAVSAISTARRGSGLGGLVAYRRRPGDARPNSAADPHRAAMRLNIVHGSTGGSPGTNPAARKARTQVPPAL